MINSLTILRQTSSRLINKAILDRQLRLSFPINMATIDELEQKRKILEEKVSHLVEKLEGNKKPDEIKVPTELVIKSKEEREAGEALEQLAISEKAVKTDVKEEETPKLKSKQPKQSSKEPPAPEKPIDISRLDLRIGKIIEVNRHPDADALYVEKIDCGDSTGPRTVISGLVNHVPIEEMANKNVVVLCNLKPVKMRGILSEAMVMCASSPEKVELLQTPDNVKPGDKVVFENYPGEPDSLLNPKKKIWEQVSVDIKTNDDGIATYKGHEFKVANVVGQFKSNLKNVQIK